MEQRIQDPDFPRYCDNECGRVLNKYSEADRVKYTRADGSWYYGYVCKRDCEPQHTYADANGFCPIDAEVA